MILDLLREPGLGAEPEAALEVESFTGRVGIADERDLAFAAAFLEGTSLGRALGRALAESAFTLTRRAGRWGLAAPALGLDEAVYPALPAADWYPGTGPRRVAGLEPGTAGGLMIRNVTEGILLREAGAMGLAVEARWLVRGAAALARFLNARRLPPAHTVSLRGDARWTGLPAGSPLSLEGLRQPGESSRRGDRARVAMEDGILEGVLAHIDDVQGLIPPGRALLLRGARALRFVIDNRVVAMLTDGGDLLIRGNLREGALAPTESTLPILFDGGQSMLLCVYTAPGGGGSSAFALTPDGDLLTTGPLVEEHPSPIPRRRAGWRCWQWRRTWGAVRSPPPGSPSIPWPSGESCTPDNPPEVIPMKTRPRLALLVLLSVYTMPLPPSRRSRSASGRGAPTMARSRFPGTPPGTCCSTTRSPRRR